MEGYNLVKYEWDEVEGIGYCGYRHAETGEKVTVARYQPGAKQIRQDRILRMQGFDTPQPGDVLYIEPVAVAA